MGPPVPGRDADGGLERRDRLRVLAAGRVGHREVVVHHHVARRLGQFRFPEREVVAPVGGPDRRSDPQHRHQPEDRTHDERRSAQRPDCRRRRDAEPRRGQVGEPLREQHADGDDVQDRKQRAEGPEEPRRGEREAAQEEERAHHERHPGEEREEQVQGHAGDELDPRRVGEVGPQESREGEHPDVLGEDSTGGQGHRGARHAGEPLRLDRHAARHAPEQEVRDEREEQQRRHHHGPQERAPRLAVPEARLVDDARGARHGHRHDAVEEREDGGPLVGEDGERAQPHRARQPSQAARRAPPGERHQQRRQDEDRREQLLPSHDGRHRLDVHRVDGEEEAGHESHPRRPVGHRRLGEPARERQHEERGQNVEQQVHQVVAEGGAAVQRVVRREGEGRHRAEEPPRRPRAAVVVGRREDAGGVLEPALHERVVHHRPAVVEHGRVRKGLGEGQDGDDRHQDPGAPQEGRHLQAPGRAYTCTSGTSSRWAPATGRAVRNSVQVRNSRSRNS